MAELGNPSERAAQGARMSPANFNSLAQLIPPGRGWYQNMPIPLEAVTWNSVTVALASGVIAGTMDDSGDTGAINIVLPGNYDQVKDSMRLNVFAIATTTTTNTLEIDDLRYWRPYATDGTGTVIAAGTAVVDPTLTSAQTASQTISASVFKKYTYSLNSIGLRPYDCVTITLGCTIAGDNVLVRGLNLEYCASLVMAAKSLRA